MGNEAEAFITEISASWDGLDATPVNQLRYAGRHLLNSLTGKTSITPEKEYERAIAHVKRAIFDAIDSGIIYYLKKIDLFKSDYWNIEITTLRYPNIIASTRKAKHLLDTEQKAASLQSADPRSLYVDVRHSNIDNTLLLSVVVNIPPAKASGFGLRLKSRIDRPCGRRLSLRNLKIVIRLRWLLVLDIFFTIPRRPHFHRCMQPSQLVHLPVQMPVPSM